MTVRLPVVRRLLITLIVLAAIVVGLDRGAAYVAGRELASRIQSQEHLPSRPDVSIEGFPFLTQVASGRYGHGSLTAHGLSRSGLTVETAHVDLYGVHVPLGDITGGHVKDVPVDRATGTARISFAAVAGAIASRTEGLGTLTLSQASGSSVRVGGKVTVLGSSYSLDGVGDVSLSRGQLRVAIAGSSLAALPSVISSRLGSLLTVSLAVPRLPYGIQLTGATVDSTGIVIAAQGDHLVLGGG